MTYRYSLLLTSVIFFCFSGVTTVGQTLSTFPKLPKIWFVARVVDVNPFTVEYLDDWYQYQDESRGMKYDFSTDVGPQGVGEHIEHFKLGDLISGEFCNGFLGWGCPEREPKFVYHESPDACASIPPNVAVNIKKLVGGNSRKWSQKGILIDYKPRDFGLVQRIRIYRDGHVSVSSSNWGGARGKLTAAELKELEGYFFSTQTDEAKGTDSTGFGSSLITIYGRLRSLKFDQRSDVGRSFTNRLDRLAERLLDDAEYRITYRWRFKIKDWEYGDVLPIDEAAKPGYEFIQKNRDRLAAIKAPGDFYEEAKERQGEIDKFMYRFRGKLYRFTFATCSDRATGSWGCYFAGEAGRGDPATKSIQPYEVWPSSLKVTLGEIPDDALPSPDKSFGDGILIPKDDFITHREFYSRFLRSEGYFQEGDFVYWGVTIWSR